MPSLTFPLSSAPGTRPGEGEGRLVNAHISKEGGSVYVRPAPGLSLDAQLLSASGPRGMIEGPAGLFSAYVGAVYYVTTLLSGSMFGSGGVSWARNIAVPAQYVAAAEDGRAYVVDTTTVTDYFYIDTDLPLTVNSVSYLGGFFLFTDPTTGRIWASELNSTDQSALSYASAEARPDDLIRGMTVGSTFFAFGSSSIEPWLNAGKSPFPLVRQPTIIPVGLLTWAALAGSQEGWDREPLFVAHDGSVRALRGYDAVIVSTPDVERFIASSTVNTLKAFVYTSRGNAFWVLSSDAGTWEYNLRMDSWSERETTGQTGWRALYSVKSAGRWFFGDRLTDRLTQLAPDGPLDGDWYVESGALKEYPARVAIPNLFLDFTQGVATGNVPRPRCEVSWSHDGGASWSAWLRRDLNPNGDPIRINRIGLSTHHGLRVRVRVSDAVGFSFLGASVPDPQARAA